MTVSQARRQIAANPASHESESARPQAADCHRSRAGPGPEFIDPTPIKVNSDGVAECQCRAAGLTGSSRPAAGCHWQTRNLNLRQPPPATDSDLKPVPGTEPRLPGTLTDHHHHRVLNDSVIPGRASDARAWADELSGLILDAE